jgi:hypothetical protein
MRNKKRRSLRALWLAMPLLAGVLLRLGMKPVWKKITGRNPPGKNERDKGTLSRTLVWTAVSGLVGAYSKLLVDQTARWAGARI